jgi:hypothetical protein
MDVPLEIAGGFESLDESVDSADPSLHLRDALSSTAVFLGERVDTVVHTLSALPESGGDLVGVFGLKIQLHWILLPGSRPVQE